MTMGEWPSAFGSFAENFSRLLPYAIQVGISGQKVEDSWEQRQQMERDRAAREVISKNAELGQANFYTKEGDFTTQGAETQRLFGTGGMDAMEVQASAKAKEVQFAAQMKAHEMIGRQFEWANKILKTNASSADARQNAKTLLTQANGFYEKHFGVNPQFDSFATAAENKQKKIDADLTIVTNMVNGLTQPGTNVKTLGPQAYIALQKLEKNAGTPMPTLREAIQTAMKAPETTNQSEEQLTARALKGDKEAQAVLDAMQRRKVQVANQSRQPKETTFQSANVTFKDGSTGTANFNPRTGKYSDPATGQDITPQVQTKGKESEVNKLINKIGAGGKGKLTAFEAASILREAGGDKNKARDIARKRGRTF